jgi:single-stranded DNA-specific DHH superfamily exonuclease
MHQLLETLKNSNKQLLLIPHWDADGIASAALIASVVKRELNISDFRILIKVSKNGRYRIRELLSDFHPETVVPVTLDLALPEPEISWMLETFPDAMYIDHHRKLQKLASEYPERVISREASSNTLLLQELLETAGVELTPRERILVKLGAICDRANVLVTEPLLAARLLPSKRMLIEEAVTLINSEYRAFWSVDTAYNCLLKRNVTDIVFNRYKDCERLHEARKVVSEELNRLIKSVKLFEMGPILYAEIRSELYIHGLLATMLMLRNQGRPTLVANVRESWAYLQLRAREQRADFGRMFFELGSELGVEAGGHKDGAGAVVPLDKLDEFLELLIQRIRERW